VLLLSNKSLQPTATARPAGAVLSGDEWVAPEEVGSPLGAPSSANDYPRPQHHRAPGRTHLLAVETAART